MKVATKFRTHIVISTDLVEEVDRLVGKRKRSQFVGDLITRELMRQRQLAAIDKAAGSWQEEDHPELRDGVDAWIRELRTESDRRVDRLNEESPLS